MYTPIWPEDSIDWFLRKQRELIAQRSRSTANPEPAGEPGPKPGGESSAMLPPIPPKQVRAAVLTVESEPEGVVLGTLPLTPLEVEMMARFGMSIR
jgi:hypothetical protein